MPKQILIYEAVIDEIKRRIADGALAPGQRLPSNQQLSQELNVGVSSVREALRALAASGVVSIKQGSGVFVSMQLPSPSELRQRFTITEVTSLSYLMEARRIIEPEIAALAAERATPEQIHTMQNYAQQMNRDFRAGRDWMEADLGFHQTLYESAGNPIIESMLQHVNDLLIDSRRETMRDRQVTERSCQYHLMIASAIADRKPMLARAMMQEHMEDAVAVFKRIYSEMGTNHKE